MSDTRWRYELGRRVYYVKQAKAPDEDSGEPGTYRVDAGANQKGTLAAHSIEHVAGALDEGQTLVLPTDPAL